MLEGMRLAGLLAITTAVLAWCGIHLYHVLQSQQPCEMTYMYAKYAAVDIPPETASHLDFSAGLSNSSRSAPVLGTIVPPSSIPDWAKDFSIRASRVAVAAEELRQTNYRLWRYTGDDSGPRRGSGLALPVLFIPGNGGSHEMARSLASETTRRVSRLGVRYVEPVDVVWYMLDLEGEWSAFDGGILEAQVQFTLAAMRHLAALHDIVPRAPMANNNPLHADPPGHRRPLQLHPGLMVVGHSMGGVVAADALARAVDDPQLGPSIAAALVTIGSPHVRPPAPGPPSVQTFYARAAARPRPVVPVLAISGGAADVQVATALTQPEGLAPQGLWRWRSLPDMPGGWCPSRHNGMVWCNQLVVALGQALVELAQDALPGLEAARSAPPASGTRGRAQGAPAAAAAQAPAAWAAAQGLDATQLAREGLVDDHTDAAIHHPSMGRSWNWALRRLDQHLAHPAQSYLAAAAAAVTATAAVAAPPGLRQPQMPFNTEDGEAASSAGNIETGGGGAGVGRDVMKMENNMTEVTKRGEEEDEDGGKDLDQARELLHVAERALAPAADGGAACGGANLAWYLQYGKPQLLKPDEGRGEVLQLLPADLEGVPAWGRMYTWDLGGGHRPMGHDPGVDSEPGPQDWAAVISGSNPCSAFRAWVSIRVDYSAAASSGGGSGGEGSLREKLQAVARRALSPGLSAAARSVRHDVEVTSLAAPLPAVSSAGGWQTRVRSEWFDITQGRDYQSRAAWLLLLPHSLLLPLLKQSGAPQTLQDALTGAGAATMTDKSGLERPLLTLQLTLWLAEPSYKPAFHVVAQTLAVAVSSKAGRRSMQPPLELLGFRLPTELPMDLIARAMAGNQARLWPPPPPSPPPTARSTSQGSRQQQQLLVPVSVPYLSYNTYERPTGRLASIVRWLGLYKYTAIRITRLDADAPPPTSIPNSVVGGSPVGDDGGGGGAERGEKGKREDKASGGGSGGGCLYATVVLVGGGGRSHLTRAASLLRISTNRTLYSLEPCTTDPWGCSAVMAVLDPACKYQLDLVPYIAERLGSLVLAHVGYLWLGAQLAALLAVAAVTGPDEMMGATVAVAARKGWWWYWRLWSWLGVPLEAVGVLQKGLLRRKAVALLLITAAAAATASMLAPRNGIPPSRMMMARPSGELPHKFFQQRSSTTSLPTSVNATATTITIATSTTRSADGSGPGGSGGGGVTIEVARSLTARTWPVIRMAARGAGLCPQPHRHDCGWTVASGSEVPVGEHLSVLDWLALGAVALLLVWLMVPVLQVASAVASVMPAVVVACWWLLIRPPYYTVLSSLLLIRRLLLGSKKATCGGGAVGTQADQAADASHVAVSRQANAVTAKTVAVAMRLSAAVWLVPLAALAALAGVPSAIPSLALLLSVFSLAMSLSAAPAQLPTAAATVTAAAVEQSAATLRWQLLERRRHTAWLLYYTAYGACAAPAAAAALRRVVRRPRAVAEMCLAVVRVVGWAMEQWWAGLGPEMLGFGLRWVHMAAVAAPAALQSWLLRLPMGTVQVLQWGVGGLLATLRSSPTNAAMAAGPSHSPVPPQPHSHAPAAAAAAAVTAAGCIFAAAHCGMLARQAASGWMDREPKRRLLAGMLDRGVVASVAMGAGCWLLALGWWFGSVDAAHVAASAVSATQLLLRLLLW